VDAPLAVFFRLFALGLEPPRAEAAARLLYSGLLLILLLVACARFARTLMGARGRAPVLVSFALSGAVFGQFIWGRVDHHGLQLALLILLLDAALRALDPQRPRAAAVTACVGVISLCVSAENAPLVAAAFAIAPLRWMIDGHGRSALGYCACGLGVALPLAALVFIPAGAQAARACDAFSYAYLFAGVCGGAVLATLWAMAPRLRAASARALALAFAGALAVLCVALLFPDCLRHPYGAIDPLVREVHTVVGGWGMAGDRMYWKPELVLSATPDGVGRRDELEQLLTDSGLDTRRADQGDAVRRLPPVDRTGRVLPSR
jgi:hypothetical protein